MPFMPKGFEWVIILIVILLIFGPKNLPKLGSALGKTVSNLREGMNDGKKKKKDASDDAAADDAPQAQVAEIEGEVETVEEAAPEPAAAAASEVDELDEVGDASAVSAEAAAGEAPKKVRRVVKKKVATGESVETE